MIANFVSYVMFNESQDLISGADIKNTDLSKINMHHTFPRNAKKDGKTFQEIYGDKINSYANLIPTDSDTNQKYINNKRPSDYYDDLLKRNNDINKHLEKSFIDIELFINEDYQNYIENRSKQIAKHINNCYLKDL